MVSLPPTQRAGEADRNLRACQLLQFGHRQAGSQNLALIGLTPDHGANERDPQFRFVQAQVERSNTGSGQFHDRAGGAFLDRLVRRGELRIDEIEYAAWQLPNMAFDYFHIRLQFSLLQRAPPDDLDAHPRRVVADFVRLYAARPQAAPDS